MRVIQAPNDKKSRRASATDLNRVDLNLFIVFGAVYTEANLTRAGQIAGITQPAVSDALSRLRETFNDPLFVYTAQGMVPTPMAQNIIDPVRNALQLLRVSVQGSRSFDSQQASETYRINMADLTEVVILSPLFQRLHCLAPDIHIESFLTKCRGTTRELAAGRLDFAVDAPLSTDPQVCHIKLMKDHYVCVVHRGHPLTGRPKLALDDYLDLTHIRISNRHNNPGYIDLALGKIGIQRKIALCSQHYLMASTVVQQTDMTMIVPERFARHRDLHYAMLLVNDVPKLETHLYWHESTDRGLTNRWVREQIIELCQQVTACENKVTQPA